MKSKKIRSLKIKQMIILIILMTFSISIVSIFGRYALDKLKYSYAKSKEFYFNSDKLGIDNPVYQIENWSGVDDYTIIINMNSFENNLLAASYDIGYEISYRSSNNVICTLLSNSYRRTVSKNTNTDSFSLLITPNTTLNTGDTVQVEITTKVTTPYEITLKGTFILTVGQEKLTYEIEDSTGSPYLEFDITNTLSYYIVENAFGSYAAGQKITSDIYKELTDAEKANCYSSEVTLTFDPRIVQLDMTNKNYLNAKSVTTEEINNYTYINSLTFKVDAISSAKVRFYKTDESRNYTYPIITQTPIITLTER